MFTGIIEERGRVTSIEDAGDHARLVIACRDVVADASLGESIAVNGCCLTVAELTGEGFAADLMAETMRATSLGSLSAGRPVNLERAMQAGDRFGGHLVQGHVDGVGEVLERRDEPGTTFVRVALPEDLARYVVSKGSITMQGASLTVVELADGPSFTVALIPHTLSVTTLGELAVGDLVNLEVDVIAKHVERLLAAGTVTPYPPTTSPEESA